MGKIRVKTLGVEELEEKEKKQAKKRAEAKTAKQADTSDGDRLSLRSHGSSEVKETEKSITTESTEPKKKKQKKSAPAAKAKHSKNYQTVAKMVEKKPYTLTDAVELLKKLKRAKFDETVELHINTIETGISGNLSLPHGTGKKTIVAIADEKIISDIEKGKIEFDILISAPEMMPKLAKVARILGPRGLMPNPKNGTVTANPQDLVKKYEGGQVSFKTEAKSPIIHLTVGKISFEEKQLLENIKTVLNAINASKIKNITLKSTMSPAIKIKI